MKKKYVLSSTDEYVDIPSGWYGDVAKFKPLIDKSLKAMAELGCSLVEFFYAGEADDEGFIEPCPDGETADIVLAGEDCGQWKIKDGYDYDDRWRGPHFRMCLEEEATLYWNAKYHDAEITMNFPTQDAEILVETEGNLPVPDPAATTTTEQVGIEREFDVHLYPVMRVKLGNIQATSPERAIETAMARFVHSNGNRTEGFEFTEDFDGFVVDEPDGSNLKASYSFEKDGITPTGKNPEQSPARVVVKVEGGLVQSVCTDKDIPIKVAIYDLDIQSADEDELAEMPDRQKFLGHIEPTFFDEKFVSDVFSAFCD